MTAPQPHHREGRVTTDDGIDLYWQAWLPDRPRAVLLFVHGLGEHSGRYAGAAAYFAARGYACYAVDCRSHGRSPGRRVDIASFDGFLADVDAARRVVGEAHAGLDQILVGHSQGGLVALAYALRRPEGLVTVVASSPLLGAHPSLRPGLLRITVRLLSRLVPSLPLPSRVDPRLVSRDPAVVEAYVRDPLVSRRVSPRWFLAVQRTLQQVHADAGRLRLPTLILAAGDDRLVDLEATRRWVSRTPAGLVDLIVWDGLFHEVFNEPEREQVYGRLASWLEGRRTA
jgi:alpha-beta hydrolase superfamily lysophospholipase